MPQPQPHPIVSRGVDMPTRDWQQTPVSVQPLVQVLSQCLEAFRARLHQDSTTSHRLPSADRHPTPPASRVSQWVYPLGRDATLLYASSGGTRCPPASCDPLCAPAGPSGAPLAVGDDQRRGRLLYDASPAIARGVCRAA